IWNACSHWAVVGGFPVPAGPSKRTMSGAISTVAGRGAGLAAIGAAAPAIGTAAPATPMTSAHDPAAQITRGSRTASPQQNGHDAPRGRRLSRLTAGVGLAERPNR